MLYLFNPIPYRLASKTFYLANKGRVIGKNKLLKTSVKKERRRKRRISAVIPSFKFCLVDVVFNITLLEKMTMGEIKSPPHIFSATFLLLLVNIAKKLTKK